jgi:hypothetical protein
MPKKYFKEPRSLIRNYCSRDFLKWVIESPLLPLIIRSTIYMSTTSLWVKPNWINKEKFVKLLLKPRTSIATLNFACQAPRTLLQAKNRFTKLAN